MFELLAAGTTINSTVFMLSVVGVSAICAVLIALNLISLKHQSTNKIIVLAATLLLLGCMVANFSIGLRSTQTAPLLSTPAAQVAIAMIAVAFLGALFGMLQMMFVPRFRRGKRRGPFTLAGAVLMAGIMWYFDHGARHPRPPEAPSQEAVIPLDPFRAVPLATPSASPTPSLLASPRPASVPRPPASASSPD